MTERSTLDLNCDLGEGATPEQVEIERRLMGLVTSVNIACGGHAGDVALMQDTVRLAGERGLAIGAHPGVPDRTTQGRREQPLTADEATALIREQVGRLQAICSAEGRRLSHIKPHGALYHMAARDRTIADAVAAGVAALDPHVILVGPPDSALLSAGRARGLRTAAEGFADRAYFSDGRLVPRGQPGALLDDVAAVTTRVDQWIRTGTMPTVDGGELPLRIDTLCLHADTPNALRIAQALRHCFEAAGVILRRLDHGA